MNCTPLVTLAVLLLSLAVRSANAQVAPLTNAEIARLVAIGVSDQTVVAVIQETSARQFDLSPQGLNSLAASGVSIAVVTAMHQSLNPPPSGAGGQTPSSNEQTLAGGAALAAAQAAAKPAEWRPRLSGNPSSSPSVPAAPRTSINTTGADPIGNDETYWKGRMRARQAEFDDRTIDVAAAEKRVAAIVREVSS